MSVDCLDQFVEPAIRRRSVIASRFRQLRQTTLECAQAFVHRSSGQRRSKPAQHVTGLGAA
jgi:hypothetical protein